MGADQGSRRPEPPRADYSLPELVDVQIHRVRYRPPQHRHFESSLPRPREVVDLTVTTDGPIPIRALGPVLYVGRAVVTECRQVKENIYRFRALEPETLEAGQPIVLAWSGQPPPRRPRSKFKFELPQR